MSELPLPRFADVIAAATRIAPWVRRTPVLRNDELDALLGAQLFFKCENLQRGGAFKFRGACNAVFSLSDDEARRGIVSQSSGNHGIAVAIAAGLRGTRATVVVPKNAPAIKQVQMREHGAELVFCQPSMASREAEMARVLAATGACLVHPFDDARVIAGQGTAALELIDEVGPLDALLAPVSGGGLLAGTAIAAHGLVPTMAVLGAEPVQADDAFQSLRQGRRITDQLPDTICDGLRAHLGRQSFALLRQEQVEIVLASEAAIVAAMRLIWDRLKIVVEPSSAVPLAALLADRTRWGGRRIGVIFSGGNVDLDHLPWQT